MSATSTKSAKKSTNATPARSTTNAAASKVKAPVKVGSGATSKQKAPPAPPDTARKSPKSAAQSAVKSEKAATKAPAKAAAREAPAAKKLPGAVTPVTGRKSSSDKAPQSSGGLRIDKADDKIAGNIHRIAVSKVTEVATKTSKATTPTSTGTVLSEAQLLKMSDKDYMNEAQLAFFKERLQQLEKDLLKNAGETTEHLRETVLVPDPADRATIEEEHALELRTRDRERKLLKKVQQSIASIDGGEYGWCEETGEPIGIPRLLARPTATLSLEAQQRRELKQKLYGD